MTTKPGKDTAGTSYGGRPLGQPLDLAARVNDTDTDAGRAALLLDYLHHKRSDVVHSKAADFSVWDDVEGIWLADADAELRKHMHQLGDAFRAEARAVYTLATSGERSDAERDQLNADAARLFRAAKHFGRTRSIDGTLTELVAMVPTVQPDEFDADPDLLACDNGVVNLRTGELCETNRYDLISKRLSVEFDPAAQAPLWERTLREVLVDSEGRTDEQLVDYFHQLIGYGITGHTSEQMLAVFTGIGANGKSVVVDTLAQVFGAVCRTASYETFGVTRRDGSAATPDVAALVGARLVFASEGDDELRLAEGLVKRLTGQDVVTARQLHRAPFEFRPRFLLMLTTNHLPTVRGQDAGIWRRIKVVPFLRYFEPHERDRNLRDKLGAEAEGILAWAVRGAVAWYANGRQLVEPPSVTAMTATYKADSNRVRDFLLETVTITGKPDDSMTASELRGLYQEWCHRLGEYPLGRNAFNAAVAADMRITKRTDNNKPVRFTGIRPKTPAEARADERGGPALELHAGTG